MSGTDTVLGVWTSGDQEKILETKGDGWWPMTESIQWIDEFNSLKPTDGQKRIQLCEAEYLPNKSTQSTY
jgi:hypothetical protein